MAKGTQQDPNKYSKNKDIKPESKRSVFISVVQMALMLIGIAGIAMEFFRDNGLLQLILHKIFQSTTSMLLIPVIIFALWFINRLTTSPNKSEMARGGDLPMYIMIAIGVYYVYRLISTGSL